MIAWVGEAHPIETYPADTHIHADWVISSTTTNIVCIVHVDDTQASYVAEKPIRFRTLKRPVVVDPVQMENDRRAMRQALNKIEQQMDSMQYLLPPKKIGRGRKPRSKWSVER